MGYRIVGAPDKWPDSGEQEPATFDYRFLFAPMTPEQMSLVNLTCWIINNALACVSSFTIM